ncbi:MAG: hypothetical protein QXT19_00900 [Candidatus Woesearchaeota archaeon]
MAGERYSHSIDISEELEKEKEEEKKGEEQPLPCFCSPKIRPKASEKDEAEEEKRDEQEQKEEHAPEEKRGLAKEENGEQQASARQDAAKDAESQQETPEKPCIEIKPADLSEDESEMEPLEEEQPLLPQSRPDPVEEDVNAIITKDIPVLYKRKSIFERLLKHKLLLLVVFVGFVAGIFFAWKMVLPEPAAQKFELEAFDAFVPPNITLFPAQIPEFPETAYEPVELPEQPEAPEAGGESVPVEVVQANSSSVDELPDFFAQRLKD